MKWRWRLAQFFERIWWRSYMKGKDTTDYLIIKKQYWQQQLSDCADVFRVKDSDSIADIGCGPAGIYIVFPNNKIVAVDPLLDKYEADLSVFSRSSYPNVTFVQSPVERFIPPQQFDYVFCMNAINHVADIQKGFEILAGCCSDAGKMIVTIDAHNNSFMKAIFRIGPGDILHPHQYDLAEYSRFVEHAGFKVLKTICMEKGYIFSHYLLVAERSTH